MRVVRSSRAKTGLLVAAILLLTLLLVATTTGCATHQTVGGYSAKVPTISASLQYAQVTVNSARRMSAASLDAGAITVDQAKALNESAETVTNTVNFARLLLARGDAAGTQAQLLAIAADVAALAVFVVQQEK